jgi:hypothetical protein
MDINVLVSPYSKKCSRDYTVPKPDSKTQTITISDHTPRQSSQAIESNKYMLSNRVSR